MSQAQLIACAWLDQTCRADFAFQRINLRPRPEGLEDEALDDLADGRNSVLVPALTTF